MGDLVELKSHGSIALITLNNPPVNAMSFAVRQENSAAWATGRMPAAVATAKATTGAASRTKADFMISS